MAKSRKPRRPSRKPQRWSQRVMQTSNALDLAPGVFTWDDPVAIAGSLKASAEVSQRRRTTPFRSAMSMLNFYVNRAGRQLPADRRACLEAAKDELRVLFHRPRKGPGKGGTMAWKRGSPGARSGGKGTQPRGTRSATRPAGGASG